MHWAKFTVVLSSVAAVLLNHPKASLRDSCCASLVCGLALLLLLTSYTRHVRRTQALSDGQVRVKDFADRSGAVLLALTLTASVVCILVTTALA